MNIIAIIQARKNSKRLPGKVLKKINNKTIIELIYENLRKSKKIDKIIVATSKFKSDNEIVELCKKKNISYFAGNKNDVLKRFYDTSIFYKGDIIVRITGDSPLIDYEIVDKTIKYYLQNNFDYVSNAIPPTYPDGLDTEVFNFKLLKKLNEKAKSKFNREHITSYIIGNKNFKIGNVANNQDKSHLRWTLDHIEDFKFIKKIYQLLKKNKLEINYNNILNLLESNPKMYKINGHIKRNQGFKISLNKNIEHLNQYKLLFKRGLINNDNIYLRDLTISDGNKKYLSWVNNKKINKFLISIKNKKTIKQLKFEMLKYINNKSYYFFAIIDIKTNSHVGNVKIGPIRKKIKSTSIGVMIGDTKFQNMGYASQAIILASKYFFYNNKFSINKIIAGIDYKNIASIKAFKNAGFVLEENVSDKNNKVISQNYSLNKNVFKNKN